MDRDIEKYAHDYLEDDFEPILVRYRQRRILELLEQKKPEVIVEVGCGADSLFNHYDKYDKFIVVEPATHFCEIARNSRHFNERITLLHDFVENKIEEIKQFKPDIVIVSSVLHETSDPKALLTGLKHLCFDTTLLHVNVPNAESFHLLWAYCAGMIPKLGVKTERFRQLQQHTVFNQQSLNDMLVQTGFRVVDCGSYFIKPFNHAKMSAAVQYGLIDDSLLDGLYKLTEFFPQAGAEIFANAFITF